MFPAEMKSWVLYSCRGRVMDARKATKKLVRNEISWPPIACVGVMMEDKGGDK